MSNGAGESAPRERRRSISENLGLSAPPPPLIDPAPRKTDSTLKGISSSSNNISDRVVSLADPEKNSLPSVHYFCVFTTKLGQKEDDRHEQILYYGTQRNFVKEPPTMKGFTKSSNQVEPINEDSPTLQGDDNLNQQTSCERNCDVALDTQVRQVGLAQAMINFSKIFSPEASCDNVHSKKARLVFFEPEPEFHFLMSIDLGVRLRISEVDKKSTVADYLDRELSDSALQGVLRQAYARFKIGHGLLDDILDQEGHGRLQRCLELFFDGYLGTVLNIRQMDIVAGMEGLPILPVTKATFLQVQSTLKALHLSFPTLETAGLIHQGRLVWSGTHLPIEAALFLTDLAKGGASLAEDPLLQLDSKKPRSSFLSTISPFFFSQSSPSQEVGQTNQTIFHPGFFTGWNPKSPYWGRCGKADSREVPLKTFYLGSPPLPIQCGLFKCWREGYLVLFFSGDLLSTPLLDELELHLHTQPLGDLETRVKEDAFLAREQISTVNKKYRYAHFNGMNLALHSHLNSLSPEVHSLLLDLQAQTKKLRPSPRANVPLELLVRTTALPGKPALWVGSRITPDSCLFFVIHRDATLAEIESDITEISNECFTNLFLG